MIHTILTNTEFFNRINSSEYQELSTAYNDFVERVIEHCHSAADIKHIAVALMYAEIELQFQQVKEDSEISVYIQKALVFVKKMQRHLSTIATQMPPLNPSTNENNNNLSLQWTGNAIDLVEMIYGISEMGCINNGNIQLNELAPVLYTFFGVNSKDCYRFYTDIKRRKNDSRTYFLDKMQVKLNEKMRRDDELERMRR
jgi:hypothetical protein